MPPNNSKLFPSDWRGRVALGLSALFFIPVSSFGAYMFLVLGRPKSIGERLMVAAAGDLLAAMTLFFTCGLIWAIATPHWLERVQTSVSEHLAVALLIFMVPFFIAMVSALIKA